MSVPVDTYRAPIRTNFVIRSSREATPPTPTCLPTAFAAAIARSNAAASFGWSCWPAIPISPHKSLLPTSSMSTPGVAMIASTFSSAATVSSITTREVAAFMPALVSVMGKLRYS